MSERLKSKTTTSFDELREKLASLGLNYAADALADELHEAVKKQVNPIQLMDQLLSLEIAARDERRIKTSLKISNLPPGMSLENFDFGFQPSIDRGRIETLGTCAFIREHTTVLLQGSSGTGKTHLAVGLGVRAVQFGFSVAFYRLDELLQEMRKDAGTPIRRLRRKKYLNVSYLVIDEMGFEVMDRDDASRFFRLINARYMKGSTVITTNKAIKDWPGIFANDEAMTVAILDRLLHRSVILSISGRSYRIQGIEVVHGVDGIASVQKGEVKN